MAYVLIALGAYLLGCSNLAYYICKIKKVDIRTGGSGNLGASNTTTLLGWYAGIAVAIHDAGKALLAVMLANLFLSRDRAYRRCSGRSKRLGPYFSLLPEIQGR